MKTSLLDVLLFAFVFAASAAYSQIPEEKSSGQTDIPKSIAESVSSTLRFAEGNLLGLAEAMPEDKYSFMPTNGNFQAVRSFGEQIKHIACAQFAFFNEFEGKKPPEDCEKGGHDPARTKSQLITYLIWSDRSMAANRFGGFCCCSRTGPAAVGADVSDD
jgi:hypothetical protein